MKRNFFALLILMPAIFCLNRGDARAQLDVNAEPFAVVELFASEGCSSCPPADDFLRELTQESLAQGARIFTLSFQVDYWNNLGWVDPFSQHQFTQRQQRYSQAFQSPSIYTPQMIINGLYGFVGSDESSARKFIHQVLEVQPANKITLTADMTESSRIAVSYQCKELAANAVLNFALVERGLESHVTDGENAGRTLKHDNIVREFKTMPLTEKEGVYKFAHPQAKDLSQYSIIAYVQNADDMKITAANKIDLK